MKFTLLPILALAGSALAAPAGQPQGAPPGDEHSLIVSRSVENVTSDSNTTTTSDSLFSVRGLHYTLEPKTTGRENLRNNVTFGVTFTGSPSNGSAYTNCDLSWSVKNKKKTFENKAFQPCKNSAYAFKVTSTPYGSSKIALRYRDFAGNSTFGAYQDYFGSIAFKDTNKKQNKVKCSEKTFETVEGRRCNQKATNGTAVAWTSKVTRTAAGSKEESKRAQKL